MGLPSTATPWDFSPKGRTVLHRGRAFVVFPWTQTNLELAFSSVGFSRCAQGGVDLLMNECELS